jgi:hypothetical protein
VANVEFTSQAITDLAQKLSTVAPSLNDQELALLLAIFAAAAERAKSFNPPDLGATLPEAAIRGPAAGTAITAPVTAQILQQQLLGAYVPGNDFDSLTKGLVITGKITPIKPPPTPRATGAKPKPKPKPKKAK